MKAELFSYDLSVNFRCPNCKLFFRLCGKSIPREKAVGYNCEGCGECISVPPVDIGVQSNKPKKQKNIKPKDYNIAKDFIATLGWSKKEASSLLDNIIKTNDITEDTHAHVLVKLALASVNEEQ
jgi:epoxyqueuosine reductase QueG